MAVEPDEHLMLETLAVVVLSAGAETGLWSSVEMVEENRMNDGIPTAKKKTQNKNLKNTIFIPEVT